MANSSSSTDTENETSCVMKKFSCGFLLSSALTRFSPLFIKPNEKKKEKKLMNLPKYVGDLQESIVSAADKFFRFENPFDLNKILSIMHSSHHFSHHFSQMPWRRRRNTQTMNYHNFAAILPGDSVGGLVAVNGISNFLNLYNTVLVVRLVLTWFPNSPPAIVAPLSTICDPYLNIFRGLIPPLGGTLDLSPILAFLVLNALTSTASALPAELPSPQETSTSSSKEKWIRRLDAQKQKSSRDVQSYTFTKE